MASQFVIDINSNDDLSTVIRKCNANFKAIMSQYAKQRQIDNNDISIDIGDAVGDLVDAIAHEADLRYTADQDLDHAIGVVDGKFSDYTPTADLAAVATSGDYNDLINAPSSTITQVDTDILKFNTNSNFTATSYRAHKYGNVVTITVKFNTLNQLNPSNYYSIGSVSTSWLPVDYVSGSGFAPVPTIADLSSTGAIRIKPLETIPANNQLQAHFSFIIT